MSSPSEASCILDVAGPADAGQLLEVLEEQPFGGAISLLYTRRPDPYASFRREAEQAEIAVGRELPGRKISCMGVCSLNTVFVNGEPRLAGYLHGLRVRASYRNQLWIQKGYQYLLRSPAQRGVSLFFTTILEENVAARRLLEKRRRSMPVYEPWDRYLGFALTTSRTAARHAGGAWRFRAATGDDLQSLAAFLNREGRSQQLFPVVRAADLAAPANPTPCLEDFRLLTDADGGIVAAGALWDQRSYKQYVVAGYRGGYRLIRPLSILLPLLGYPRLPARGAILNFAALSFWAVKDGDPRFFERFLSEMRAAGAAYDFLFLGLAERHPLVDCLKRIPHHHYASRLYTVGFEQDQGALAQIDRNRLPYLEVGRL